MTMQLARPIVKRLEELRDSGCCRQLKGLWSLFECWDCVIYILRMDARILSGKNCFAQAYAFTGPPSGGKSWVLARLTAVLGQGGKYLTVPLPPNYFNNPVRQDAEGSKPVSNQCMGARLIAPKEVPAKPIDPEALKSVLDPRDLDINARANNSSKREDTTFPVTWAIVLLSQGAVTVKEGETDTGLSDKIVELRPPFQFKEPQLVRENTRERPADKKLHDDTIAKLLAPETIFWSVAMQPLLGPEICTNRGIYPVPEQAEKNAKEAQAVGQEAKIKEWMCTSLEHCTVDQASTHTEVLAAMSGFGKINASVLTAVGLGDNKDNRRKRRSRT